MVRFGLFWGEERKGKVRRGGEIRMGRGEKGKDSNVVCASPRGTVANEGDSPRGSVLNSIFLHHQELPGLICPSFEAALPQVLEPLRAKFEAALP